MKTKLFLSLSLLTMAFSVVNANSVTVYEPINGFRHAAMQKFANIQRIENVKAAAKIGGLYAGFASVGLPVHMYMTNKEAQAEATRLANRSYTEKFMDGVSHYAQAAKANTWDKELFGYKQGGKVATTVAGVAAVAGLSYLAYKKNPFGKAVVKTVAPKVVTPVAKRKLSVI